jgi:hypothetical protein
MWPFIPKKDYSGMPIKQKEAFEFSDFVNNLILFGKIVFCSIALLLGYLLLK